MSSKYLVIVIIKNYLKCQNGQNSHKRQWFSGKIEHSHCLAPGSIPGWRKCS